MREMPGCVFCVEISRSMKFKCISSRDLMVD